VKRQSEVSNCTTTEPGFRVEDRKSLCFPHKGTTMKKSFILSGVLGLLSVTAAFGAYKFARGAMSPFTGNQADLVTVHLTVDQGPWQIVGSIFDNGSILISNSAPKGKRSQPCGPDAVFCVCAPSAWVRSRPRLLGGGNQLLFGNELSYGSLMFKQELTWRRLPGDLQVTLYVTGNPLAGVSTGSVSSDKVAAAAGSEHHFRIGPEAIAGGTTIRITGQ
jgi:hypothetical protein